MARSTVDRQIGIGTVIHGRTCDYTVTRVLKHAYEVTADRPDVLVKQLWSFEVVPRGGKFYVRNAITIAKAS